MGKNARTLLIAATLALAVGAVAIADTLRADGDGVVPIGDVNMAAGSVGCDQDTNKTALLGVRRNGDAGNPNVFADGSTVTISVVEVTGTNASALTATVPPAANAIHLPADWGSKANNTISTETVSSGVKIHPTATGPGSATVKYRASGIEAKDGTAYAQDDTMDVTWTAGACAVTDSTAPVITPHVSGSLGDNGWYTSDVDVTFTVVDNESSISSKSNACDATTTIDTDTAGQLVSCTATSAGGTDTGSVTIKRDASAPSITAARKTGSEANGAGWNKSSVTVEFTCSDNGPSGLDSSGCPADVTKSAEGRDQVASGGVKDNAGNTNSASVTDIDIDLTGPSAPTASPDRSPEDATGEWFKDTVTVSYGGSTDPDLGNGDAGSGVASYTAPEAFSTTGSHGYSGRATDAAGNDSSATTGSVKVDATDPSVSFGGCPTTVFAGSTGSVTISASDGESGLATDPSDAVGVALDTASVGPKSISATAVDNVGHSVTEYCNYSVVYNASGLFQPIGGSWKGSDTPSSVLNRVKAGSSVPVKFSLDHFAGLLATDITVKSAPIVGVPNANVDSITASEVLTPGASGLTYDPTADQYVYVWKTEKGWTGTKRQLIVTLNDGTVFRANFDFTK